MESVYSGTLLRFYASVFLAVVTHTALYLIVPLYSYSLKASQIEIGLVSAVYWMAQIPCQIVFGKLCARGRQRLLLLVGIGGEAFTTLIFPFTKNVIFLILIRLVQGIFISAFWPATRSLAAEEAPPLKTGEVMGLYGVAMSLSGVFGPVLGGYMIDYHGYLYAFLMASLFSMVGLFPLLIGWRPREKSGRSEVSKEVEWSDKARARDSGYGRRILLIACMAIFIQGLVFGAMNSIFPVYLKILSFMGTEIGVILMAQSASLLIFQWVGGRLSDRASRTLLTTLGVALCTSMGAVAVINSFVGFVLVMVMVGVGVGILYPAGLTLISELPPNRKGIAFGIFGSAATTGMAVGSQFGGALAQYLFLTAPYYFEFIVSGLVAVAMFSLHRKNVRSLKGNSV